jgi:hypothetical protein
MRNLLIGEKKKISKKGKPWFDDEIVELGGANKPL